MKIKLKTQHGQHQPGTVHEVESIVPHGGYTDSARQYVLAGGQHVASDNAEVISE